MSSINKCILIGNLGKDVELTTLPSGTKKAKFSIATSSRGTDKKTTWHNIIAWNKTAELCSTYLRKGSKVYVEGEINYRKYTDKNNVERDVTEIVAFVVEFLDSKNSNNNVTINNSSDSEEKYVTSEIGVDDFAFDLE